MMMRHLIWKDAQTIRPLVIAIAVGIIGLHLMMLLLLTMTDAGVKDIASGLVSLWILMPNLVALGAPSLLVGGEEESGTLNWLRTLPVSWQKVIDSKFLVAVGAVVATWLAASVVLVIALAATGSLSGDVRDMVTFASVLYLAFFSMLLLSTGFALAYLFRSPVTALIAVIPLIAVLNGLALGVGSWILGGQFRGIRVSPSTSTVQLTTLFAAGTGTLVLLWIVQRLLGRRRMTRREGSVMSRWNSSPTVTAYRPPARAGSGRPSQTVALLWQQGCQMRWQGLMVTAVVAFFLAAYYGGDINPSRAPGLRILTEFSPLVVTLGACWLGTLAFYGDNVRRRCAFLADRGLSPNHVWWTRLAPSALCLALLLSLAISLQFLPANWRWHGIFSNTRNHPALLPCLLLVGFAFGQLVGQWVRRPTLAFFGAPAYGLFSCMVLFFLFSIYVSYAWTSILMVPVLLFATWRLTRRWLDDRIDGGFSGRVLAYTALATLVPVVTVFGHRYATTPGEMRQWRAEMLASDDPAMTNTEAPRADWMLVDSEIQMPRSVLDDDPSSLGKYIQFLKAQLAAEGPGEIAAVYAVRELIPAEVVSVADPDDIEQLQRTSVLLLLKWATMIREDIASGRADVWPAIHSAASAEMLAAQGIVQLSETLGTTSDLAQLAASIPSDALRERSRRIGLIRMWRQYQRTPWKREVAGVEQYGKGFMGQRIAANVDRIPLERTRADRFIDLATRRSLEQLDTGLPPLDSVQTTETNVLWSEAGGPRQSLEEPVHPFLPWPNDSDLWIDALRGHYGNAIAK